MGTNNLIEKNDGEIIEASDLNQFEDAFAGDLVPRNSSGVPTSEAGNLGTSSLPFKSAQVTTGYFFPGLIIPMHTYNGTLEPGQGWMKCDGRIVNETNYDAEFASGDWDNYIVSSPLDGLYLPDLTGSKYLSGVSATTQDGSLAITEVGNASNEINLQHSHTVDSHNHKWFDRTGGGRDNSFNSSGTSIALDDGTGSGSTLSLITQVIGGGGLKTLLDWYTDNQTPGTNNQLSTTQSIQPRSVEVVYYMRIV